MKQRIMNIKKLMLCILLVSGLTACNKEETLTKAVSIHIAGYNIGNSELEVSIDELKYDKFKTQANRRVEFSKVYTFPSTKGQALLGITDLSSAKKVFEQKLDLNSGDRELFFPFVFINGSELAIKPLVPDPATNKLAFYIYYPESTDAIDIFIKNDAGEISYIAKNVTPSTWFYTDYLTADGFKQANKSYAMYFTKTGTTDFWAFKDSEQVSKSPTDGSVLLPKMEEKGLIRSYFITPTNNQLDVVSLFKRL